MKRIEIGGQELEKLIHSAAASQDIEVGKKEQDLIDQIVDSAPETLTSSRLGSWCKAKVDGLIKEHPELQDRAETVRIQVRNELNYRLLADRLTQFKQKAEEAGVKTMSPRDISNMDNLLYQSVQHAFRRKDGQIDWDYFSQKTGIEVKYKTKTIGEAIQELKEKVALDDPPKFGPYFIRKKYPDLYNVIWNFNLPWSMVIGHLDKKYQERWKAQPIYEEVKPKNTYRNEEEVNSFLDQHRNELSTIVEAGPNDIAARDKIIAGLVLMAQQGNDSAFDRALEYSEYIVSSWILKRKLDPKLENFTSDIKDAIGRCIYLYKGTGSFVAYIFTYIKLMGRGIKAHDVEYKEDYAKHSGSHLIDTNYDFKEDESEEVELTT